MHKCEGGLFILIDGVNDHGTGGRQGHEGRPDSKIFEQRHTETEPEKKRLSKKRRLEGNVRV
ncbi:hypothetical protein ZHAS_00015417 [Anopheles sinensis]|uniref:Uncharacterized protein n=1 Tax=Anopheles sinensis TaxID=74873 RepID=A0A084WB73_ANOSI|nr:hypothetical protein ZHAS_00015417 [Anopheles sinensis]